MKSISQDTRYHYPENTFNVLSLGLVTDYNPSTMLCSVQLDKGPHVTQVPVLGMYGSQFGTDLTTLPNLRGATVVLVKIHNQLFVLSTVPAQLNVGFKVSEAPSTPGYGGGNQYTYGVATDKNCSAMRATEYLPGDRISRVNGGAESGLLQEGVAYLRTSALCQFVLCKFKDLGRLVTRVFQHFTDFGEINITHNSSGRVGLHLKGGADFINETHPLKARWTVQAWVGDHPGSETDRLHVRVNDADNTKHVTLTFNTEGEMLVETTGDKHLHVGKDHYEDVDGKRETFILGKEDLKIMGGKTEVVNGKFHLACSALNITKLPS